VSHLGVRLAVAVDDLKRDDCGRGLRVIYRRTYQSLIPFVMMKPFQFRARVRFFSVCHARYRAVSQVAAAVTAERPVSIVAMSAPIVQPFMARTLLTLPLSDVVARGGIGHCPGTQKPGLRRSTAAQRYAVSAQAYAHRMTDESLGHTLDDDALSALLERPLTDLSTDELMALKDAYAARGIRIYNSVPWEVAAPLMALAAVYAKTFVETLAKHHADAVNDAVDTRIRKKGKTRELLIGPEDGSAAILIITNETPDEARLALLDLDVTAEEVRGKALRWDDDAVAWRRADD
jgi:hypothetical protein